MVMRIGFGIRVVDENGKGVKDAEVQVQFQWAEDKGRTDDDGWVRFEKHTYFGDSVSASVYVNGEIRDEGIWIGDGNTLSYCV